MKINYNNFNPKELGKNIRRSLKLLWETSKPIAIWSFILHIVQAMLPVASLYVIKILVDQVTNKFPFSELVTTISIFLGIQLLLALIQQYIQYITTIFQLKLTDHLSQKVLNKAIEVDYDYYENPDYHNSLHLAQQQSFFRAGILLTSFNSFITSGFALLFLLLLFISMKSFFALIFIAFSIPLAIIKWYFGIAIMQQERKLTPQEREASYLHQILTGVSFAKDTRVFGFGNYFIEKFATIRKNILRQKQGLNKKLTTYSLLAESVEIIAMAVIFGMLAKQSIQGAVSLGLFVIYIQGFQSLQTNSKNFLQSIVQILHQRVFLQDLFAFLDIKLALQTNSLPFPKIKTGLTISNLSFRYPSTEKEVLHQISMHCQPGQVIAIVGENGSGKSTLIKLLAKLYQSDSGTIRFDEIELNKITTEDYRKQSVFLFQDFEKYFFTIEENIVLGNSNSITSKEKIIQAAQSSGADGFINKLPKAYQTRMGSIFEGSQQLSGGEWQKLALSRVFYRKDARLIVLDEPTSALDAQAEYDIFNQIKSMAKDKMVILITHRLYNLKMANYLYVMQEGHIAEHGEFNELIEKGGLFTKLFNMQQI